MFNYLNNKQGVALLVVMVIMTVLITVGSIVLYISSSESRVVYDYGNNARAFYVAEAGADLAINEWKNYIAEIPVSNIGELGEAYVEAFQSRLEAKKEVLIDQIKSSYNDEKNISIEYPKWTPDEGKLNSSSPTTPQQPHILTIEIEGTYDDTVYKYELKLWYYLNKSINSYKGFGKAIVDTSQDTTPPIIISNEPINGNTNVPIDKNITVTFSEPVFQGVNFNNITLMDDVNNPVDVNLSASGDTITLEPENDLNYNTQYKVTIPYAAVKDNVGNQFMASSYSFIFDTGNGSGGTTLPQPPAFTYNSQDWNYTGNWQVNNKEIYHHSNNNKSPIIYVKQTYPKYDYKVSLNFAKGNGNDNKVQQAGLIFGPNSNGSSANYFYIEISTSKKVSAKLNGVLIANLGNFSYDATYQLEVIANDSTLELLVNGQQYKTYQYNTTLPGDYLGLKEDTKGIDVTYYFE